MVLLKIMMIMVAIGIVPTAFWVGMYIDTLYEPLPKPEDDLENDDITTLEWPIPQL